MRQMTTPPQLSSRRLFIFGGAVAVLGLALLLYTFKFSKILSSDDFARLTNVGKNYFDKGEAEKAVASFQQALQLNTAHPDAHLNLANAYFLAGQNENVIKEAQEVLSLDRNSAAAHYLIGCVNLRLGKNEDALKELQESQNIDPAVTALNFQLSLAHEKLGHLEDAARELEAVIKFEPDHPAAHYRLSQLLLRLGNKEEANQHLEQHRQIIAKKPGVPTDPSAYERCKHTQARLPFQMEQPDPRGVKGS